MRSDRIIVGLLIVAGLALWLPQVGGQHFCDDYDFIFDTVPMNEMPSLFIHRSPNSAHYRPVEAVILASAQNVLGIQRSAYFTQGLAAACHVALCVWSFAFLRRFGVALLPATLGVLFAMAHPVAVGAILGNDTLSQVMSVLFGYLGLWGIISGSALPVPLKSQTSTPKRMSWLRTGAGIAALIVALLCKETAIGFVCLAGLFTIYAYARIPKRPVSAGAVPVLLLALLAGYFLLRMVLGLQTAAGESAKGATSLTLGWNILSNPIQLLVSTLMPFSSVDVFTAAISRQWMLLAAFAMPSLAIAIAICIGAANCMPGHRGRSLAIYGLCLFGLIFPFLFIRHVSELYAYQILPVVAVGVALFFGTLASSKWKVPAVVVMILLMGVMVQAIFSKAYLQRKNGQAASTLVNELVPIVRQLPPHGTLVLYDAHATAISYSFYLQRGFDVVMFAPRWIKNLANRPDVSILIVQNVDDLASFPSATVVELVSPNQPELGLRTISQPATASSAPSN